MPFFVRKGIFAFCLPEIIKNFESIFLFEYVFVIIFLTDLSGGKNYDS